MDDACPEIRPVTEGALMAVRGASAIKMRQFPFRIGRESRYVVVDGATVSMERRKTDCNPNNDLYVLDTNKALNVSREHCQIEKCHDGSLKVVDRGSTCGTIVDGAAIGAQAASCEALAASGTRIVLGTRESPFEFEIFVPHHEDA